MKLFLASLVSWMAGLATYYVLGTVEVGDSIGEGDLIAVVFYSLYALVFVFPLVYLPSMLLIRKVLGGYRPRFVYPLTGALLFVIPTMVVFALFGGVGAGFFRTMFIPEAVLFHCMFVVVGGLFGWSFVWLKSRSSKN